MKNRHSGQIIERGPEKFLLRIFEGTDSAGKRHYYNETFRGKKTAAKERLRELIRKHQAGERMRAGNETLSTFLDEWLEAARLRVKEVTIRQYRNITDWYIRPNIGGLFLAKIDAAQIQSFYRTLEEKGLSPGTRGLVHIVLGMAFKLAIKRQQIARNPMVGVEAPAGKRRIREAHAMTGEEIGRFLEAANVTRLGALFVLACHTGCRPGELLGLKWDDIDQEARTLIIQRTLAWRSAREWYLDNPKTALSRRALPLTDSLIERLAIHKRAQLEDRMRAGKAWNDHGFIFANQIGEPLQQSHIRYQFKEILKAAGLPAGFRPYDMRHSVASLLMAAGVNPKVVSERLGHSNVAITLNTYSHVSPGLQAAASQEMERLISGKKG